MKKIASMFRTVSGGLVVLALLAHAGFAIAQSSKVHSIPLLNRGFELPHSNGQATQGPAHWYYYGNLPQNKSSIHVSRRMARSGRQSLKYTALAANATEGYWQPIRALYNTSESVTFSAYLKADPKSPLGGTAKAMLGVEFHLPGGAWLNHKYLQINPSQLSTTQWQKFKVTVSPKKAITHGSIHFVVSMATGNAPRGAFYVDDVSAAFGKRRVLHDGRFDSPLSNGKAQQGPAGWFYYGNLPQGQSSIRLAKHGKQAGTQCLQFNASAANAVEGYWQRLAIPYNTSDVVTLTAYLKAVPKSPLGGTARAQLGIEFHLPGGSWLNQKYLRIKPSQLSTTHWTKFTITASPSKQVSGGSVHFVISMTTGSAPHGAFYVDDASAKVRVAAKASNH